MKRSISAAELLAKLDADPEYKARTAQRDRQIEQRAAESRADERLLVEELRALGYVVDSVWDFVNNNPHPVLKRKFIGPYEKAYATLARHLSLPHHKKVREGVIRALTEKNVGDEIAEILLREFLRETDGSIRWVLANALKVAMPLKQRRTHPEIERVYRAKGAL